MNKPHIPNPCPEKWSEMSPTEQGAFCHRCATEVIDFTHMSTDEIKSYLKQAGGKKICGKMPSEERKFDFPNELINQPGMTGFRNRLLYAMALVFGITFAGCKQKTYDGPVGMMRYEPDSTEEIKPTPVDTNKSDERPHKVGKMQYDPDKK